MKTMNLGNNEEVSTGITEVAGGFLALTFSQSKTFKTFAGASKWLAARGFKADGSRI